MNRDFLNRFESLWRRKRRMQFGEAVAATVVLAVAAFCLLVAADYALELGPTARTLLFGAAAVMVLFAAGCVLWWAARRGTQPRTAAEVEAAFPVLGQSVRTTVQFGDLPTEQIRREGVRESLVSALADRTDETTRPLGMDIVIPKSRFLGLAAGGAALVLVVAAAYGFDWEFRTAARRAALGASDYRSLIVEPGDLVVDEGMGTKISVALVGRTNREVVFLTRPADQPDAEWATQQLEPVEPAKTPDADSAENNARPSTTSGFGNTRPRLDYLARFDRLTEPFEYRVTAGNLESELYRVDIRRPVKIREMKVELTPPEYTRQPPNEISDGNIAALAGAFARFKITFDKPVKSAAIIMAPRVSAPEEEAVEETLPLLLEGMSKDSARATLGRAEMELLEDRRYRVVAEAEDGTRLVEKKYRIRIREDQPPQVTFDSPQDAIEVHTLAELPVRVQVKDDYGLAKAGVVFQINNEQEIPLIAEDFEAVAAAAREIETTGRMSPKTQTVLEQLLPLEHFLLTQKDSVMYFAWAEDNRPGTPQRTETDMRFIDIRPFKREYQVIDPDPMPGGGGGGGGFRTLEELIQRQRFGLNRTLNIERHAAIGRLPDPTTLEQLMEFERDLAENVSNTAMGLEDRGFSDTELFYQAQASILQAVDSLSVGKWENATLQMRDALKFLIEQRDRTREFLLKNPDAAQLAALRAFDRMQAQKLRRPKTDKEEARELVRRLEILVGQENSIVDALNPEPAPAAVEGAEAPTEDAATPSEALPAETAPAEEAEAKATLIEADAAPST
jgi:hypothetical protein